jgi:uncharacterized protein YggE
MQSLPCLLLVLLLPVHLFAQVPTLPSSPDNRIVVLGEAFIELPADRVVLTVTLAARDSASVQRAYEKHKRLEADLVRFLREAALPDSAVRYQLLNVRQEMSYTDRRQVPSDYVTTQAVLIRLGNVRQYADFLVKLIGAGFTNVSAQFTASQAERVGTKLLQNAVGVARQKAQVLATASGRRLGRVSKVMDTEEIDPVLARQVPIGADLAGLNEVVTVGYGQQLTDIPQTIRLAKQVKVVFILQ